MARLAGKMRGDLRALEEQRNSPRTNPVRGAGATPSMGLSQYRGGMSGCGDSESDEELQGGALERMVGAGRGCGTGAGTGGRKRRGKTMNEATAMGLHLGKHLHALHGGSFFDDFGRGFMSVIRPAAGIAKSVAPLFGPEGAAVSGVLGSIGLGKARRGRGTGAGQLTITHGGGDEMSGGRTFLGDMSSYLGKKLSDPNSAVGNLARNAFSDVGSAASSAFDFLTKERGGRRRRGGASVAQSGAYEGQGRERDDVAAMLGSGELQGSGFLSDMLGNIPLVGGPASAITGMFGLGNNGGRRRRGGAMLGADGHGQLKGKGPFMKAFNQIRNEVVNDMRGKGNDELQGSGFLSDMLGNIPLVGGPASAITGMFGLGNNGGRKRRAPAGPNDGRRRRAEIVKKVMADKGCSMIEASKYVKAHGLY